MLIRRFFAVLVVLVLACLLFLYWNQNNFVLQAAPRASITSNDEVERKVIGQQQENGTIENAIKPTTHLKVQFTKHSDENPSKYHENNGGIYNETKGKIFDETEIIAEKESEEPSNPQKSEIPDHHGKPMPNLLEEQKPSTLISEFSLREKKWKEALDSCVNQTKEQRLPDIIGIGTEKCGTDALITFLSKHPLIRIKSGHVETHYFDESRNGLRYYKSLMPEAEKCALVMEKTPAYFSFPPEEIPQRIKKSVPHAKLLLVLCDPVKRAFSDFVHEWVLRKMGLGAASLSAFDEIEKYLKVYLPLASKKIPLLNETKPYQESKELLKWHRADHISHILTTGLYAHHLKRWLRVYNETNLMIIDGDEMFQNPGVVIEKVQNFLGIPKLILRSDFVKDASSGYYCYRNWINEKMACLSSGKQRTRGGKRKLKPETEQMLKSFYQRHNEDLFKLLGRRFNW